MDEILLTTVQFQKIQKIERGSGGSGGFSLIFFRENLRESAESASSAFHFAMEYQSVRWLEILQKKVFPSTFISVHRWLKTLFKQLLCPNLRISKRDGYTETNSFSGGRHVCHTHIERQFAASASVRDIVIGMADGLTVFGYIKGKFTGAKPLRSACAIS